MVWEDSPSHVCRGGDKRALSFCCPPVKPCPVIYALEDAKLTAQEYIEIKEKYAENTKLGQGEGTCFGSLVWCCKPSKPCPLRDMVMRRIDMSVDEYMDLKKQLSEELVGKHESNTNDSIIILSETFNVSEEEALEVLKQCDNNVKKAAKLLKMKNLEL
jgi:putative methanogenesis marker domain 9